MRQLLHDQSNCAGGLSDLVLASMKQPAFRLLILSPTTSMSWEAGSTSAATGCFFLEGSGSGRDGFHETASISAGDLVTHLDVMGGGCTQGCGGVEVGCRGAAV